MPQMPRFNEKNGFFSSEKSTQLMKKIRSNNTKPEIMLRKVLWQMGYRYRLNYKKLPGKPDIVLVSHRLVIFVDGSFWHGYNWTEKKEKIKTNRAFWIPKIQRTIERDKEVTLQLINAKWCVLRFWDHEVKSNIFGCLEKILFVLHPEIYPLEL